MQGTYSCWLWGQELLVLQGLSREALETTYAFNDRGF